MKQGTREAMVLSEVMRSNSCMIDHFNLYLNHCQDQQLRSILDRQQRHNLDSAQKMMQMIQSHGIDTNQMPQPSTTMSMATGGSQAISNAPYGTTTPTYSTPMGHQRETGTTAINDRVIADGMLAFHKCGAETVTRAALESAEPHLRNALTNMARNCIEMSYEIYNYMHQRGWYQLPANTTNFISHTPVQQQFHPQ